MAPSLPVGMRRAPPCVVCSKSCQQRRNISISVPPTIFKFPKTVAHEVGAVHPPGHCRGLGAAAARRGMALPLEPHGSGHEHREGNQQPVKKRAVENEKGTSKTTTGVVLLGPPWEPEAARFLVGCYYAVMLQWLGT